MEKLYFGRRFQIRIKVLFQLRYSLATACPVCYNTLVYSCKHDCISLAKMEGDMQVMALSARATTILEIIRAQTDWLSRNDLARALGRTRLNQGDFVALAELRTLGLIEEEKRSDPRPIGFMYDYRTKK